MNKKEEKYIGLRFLLPYIGSFKSKITIMFIAMITIAATTSLLAYMMKPMLNNIFIEKNEDMLWILPLIIIALFIVRGVARYVSGYTSSLVGIGIVSTLRSQMFRQAIHADYDSIQAKSTSVITKDIIQMLVSFRNIIANTIPSMLISALTIIGMIITIIYLDWFLALSAIGFASLLIVPIRYLSKSLKKNIMKSENVMAGMIQRIHESFSNIDLVKIHNNEAHEEKLFNQEVENYKKLQMTITKHKELTSPVMETFVSIAVAFVVYSGGYAVINETMTVGDFFAFVTALMLLYAPVKDLTKNTMVLTILDALTGGIKKFLSIKQELHKDVILNRPIESIKFENVSLHINKKPILEDITFEINQNDTVAIVGKTGAGKSSLLSLLFAFRASSKGKILINGIDINTIDSKSIRQQISYVNQQAGAFQGTIKENIIYGLEYDETKYNASKEIAHCEFIEEKNKKDNELVAQSGKNLSGGQRQRLALARALYKPSSLFVLDEATSALDVKTENDIQEALHQILNSRTSIIIAHRLNTIVNCNKVIVLSGGKIVDMGTYKEVAQNSSFKQNFGIK